MLRTSIASCCNTSICSSQRAAGAHRQSLQTSWWHNIIPALHHRPIHELSLPTVSLKMNRHQHACQLDIASSRRLTGQAGHEARQRRPALEPKIDTLSRFWVAHDLIVGSADELVRHRSSWPRVESERAIFRRRVDRRDANAARVEKSELIPK